MTQFQNFIKNKQVKIQQKLKYFLKSYEMPFQFSSLLQVVLKIVSLKWRPPMSMQFSSLSRKLTITLSSMLCGIALISSVIAAFRCSKIDGQCS